MPGATNWRAIAALGADLRPLGNGRGHHGQRRICLGQSDRADAHGPLPRRGGRRCARQPARIRRAQGDPRILRQRRRRAGRRARPLGPPALPRGARRGRRRRSPKGSIPATISCRSARRSRPSSAIASSTRPRAEWLALFRTARGRGDDGHDPRRSRAARHPPRRLRVGGRAAGGGQARGGGGLAARARPRLRRRARGAQGRDARGLGAGRAAAVPLDRASATTRTGRSASRTAAGPISAPTSPITIQKAQSRRRADRHLGRGPRRHGQADQGRGRGADRRQDAGSTSSWSRWSSCCAAASRSRCRSAPATS